MKTCNYEEDYEKVVRVIHSCKNIKHLNVARKLCLLYYKKYPTIAHNLGIVYTSKETILMEINS